MYGKVVKKEVRSHVGRMQGPAYGETCRRTVPAEPSRRATPQQFDEGTALLRQSEVDYVHALAAHACMHVPTTLQMQSSLASLVVDGVGLR